MSMNSISSIIKAMGTQYYGGVIWTNHALKRMHERGLGQDLALQTFKHPDKTSKGQEKETTLYRKSFDKSQVTVIAKQNEKREWLVLSSWIDPPVAGSWDDRRNKEYRKYQHASFWMKLFITVKRQLGISKF